MDDFLKGGVNMIPLGFCTKCGKCSLGYPESVWSKMPDGCRFEGWLFQARETVKQKIRVQKEELLLLEIALKTLRNAPLKRAQKRISEIKNEIEKYSEHGSVDW